MFGDFISLLNYNEGALKPDVFSAIASPRGI